MRRAARSNGSRSADFIEIRFLPKSLAPTYNASGVTTFSSASLVLRSQPAEGI